MVMIATVWIVLPLSGSSRYHFTIPQKESRTQTHRKNYRQDLFSNLMHNEPRCQRTQFHPFRVGCPSTCVGFRPDANESTAYFRTNLAWYFGQAEMADKLPEHSQEYHPGVAYDKGLNFQCPRSVAKEFQRAEQLLRDAIFENSTTHSLMVSPQARMHLSLAYICCLEPHEIHWVHQAFHEWILDRHPFEIPLEDMNSLSASLSSLVKDLQCWHERDNSVSNILVTSPASQYRLQNVYHDLMQYIEQRTQGRIRGDYVHRSKQMPFHLTLLGVHRCLNHYTGKHNESCALQSKDLDMLYQATQKVMKEMPMDLQEHDSSSSSWVIRHAPRYGTSLRPHTWPEGTT